MYKFHLVPLFSTIINLVLGGLVIATNRKRRLNQIFFGLGIVLAWWNAAAYFHANTQTIEHSLKVFRFGAIAVSLLPAALYHLVVESTARKHGRWTLIIVYSCSILFTILLVAGAPMSSGMRRFGNMYRVTGSSMVWLFYLFFSATSIAAILQSAIGLRTAPSQNRRFTRLVVIAVSVLALGVMHDGMHVLGLNYYPGTHVGILPLGTACASLYALVLGYGLLSDQVLDFRISLGGYSANLLRILFVVIVAYILLLSLASMLPGSFTNEGLLMSLATFFTSTLVAVHFFPKLLGEYVDHFGRRITGDSFEKHDKIRTLIRDQGSTEPFVDQVEQAAILLLKQFGLTAVGISIFATDERARCVSTKTSVGNPDWSIIFGEKSVLRAHFKTANQAYLDVREVSDFGHAERVARDLMAEQSLVLAFPIGTDDRKPIGLLVAGQSKDGRSLNRLDAEIMLLLCHHIAARAERIALERNEELQKSNEAKDLFLASVNHEIRNPLNGITGVVQMLEDHCTDPRARFLLGTLQTCTDQLRTTMDDVLDFNQIGPEVPSNHPSRVALVELVRSITKSYDFAGDQLLFGGVTGDLKSIQSAEPELLIWCDSGKLSHILTNYLINSLKYGVPPGACVQLHAEAKGDAAVRVKLTVTSTGPTLSPDEVLSLFTPLTRGRRAQETKANGLGLGLALSKKLAEAMGGNVGVESAHGKTTFWFVAEFPIVNSDNPKADRPVLDVAGRFALAIEDEPYNRLVLGYHLNRFGISPVWASDGAAALSAAQNRSFDLIILDWRLPDMDGEELLSKLRANSPKPLPPVVVVSAYSSANKRAASFAVGAAAFVNKPIDEAKLAEALGTCKLGPPVKIFDAGDSPTELLDISALKAASSDPAVIESFLREIEQSCAKLLASWKLDARAAASLAHRLKGQMLLVRAKESAGLLEVMERALNEGAASADIERLAEAIQREFATVIRSIRGLTDSAPGTASA